MTGGRRDTPMCASEMLHAHTPCGAVHARAGVCVSVRACGRRTEESQSIPHVSLRLTFIVRPLPHHRFAAASDSSDTGQKEAIDIGAMKAFSCAALLVLSLIIAVAFAAPSEKKKETKPTEEAKKDDKVCLFQK